MKTTQPEIRAYALDALRGYAIITMVLSATVAPDILPGWMYHTQTPPPGHVYNEALSGLTWVDLVFPFFLFSMGAAFPFSLGKKLEKGVSKLKLTWDSVLRGLQLTFFAIFIEHFYPYMLSAPQDPRAWGLALLAFALLFPMFMRIPLQMPNWLHTTIKLAAYAVATLLMLNVEYAGHQLWSPYSSNIIILLLANMAVFGSVLYVFTNKNHWLRFGLLLFFMAVFFSATVPDSWAQKVFLFSPFPWMYQFTYLKYLFIVIPGAYAGEFLMNWMKSQKESMDTEEMKTKDKRKSIILVFFIPIIIISNLYFLYTRQVVTNLFVTVAILLYGHFILKQQNGNTRKLWQDLFHVGAMLLLLGLCFESYQGGIKKDPPSYSYFFVTSGLAFLALLFFNILCDFYGFMRSTKFLIMSGQNPMIAYVAGDLLIMPLFGLLGITPLLQYFNINPEMGFLRGVILTSLSVLVTMFFTRIKWFWRT